MNDLTVPISKVYGLTALQNMLMQVYCNPTAMLANPKYGKVLSTVNVADYLGVHISKVNMAINDEAFLRVMYEQTTLNLRMKKALVDKTLIDAATDPNPKHSADRKLFYQLIGAMDDKGEPSKKDTLTREQKLEAITKVLGVVNKANLKGALDARPERTRPRLDSGQGGVSEGEKEIPVGETDRKDGTGPEPGVSVL